MISGRDTALLQRLGGLAREVDPAPGLVQDLGRAAFGLRRLDSELAELVADSDVALAGVRSAGGSDTRLLSFEAGELVIDVQVSSSGSGRLLLGQVAGGSAGVVALDTAELGRADAALDELGDFRFDRVRSGAVRLSVELTSGLSVTTGWFRL